MMKDDQSQVNEDRIMLKQQVEILFYDYFSKLTQNFSLSFKECCYSTYMFIAWL